jgi:hypothetical protein
MIGALLTLLCCVGLAAQNPSPTPAKPAAAAPASTLEGKVKSGTTPVPGATVGATNPATGQKVVGWTQTDGSYTLALPTGGEYVVQVQMTGFAVATQHVTVSAANPHPRLDLQITLLSRAQGATAGAYARGNGAGNRGFQTLSVMAAEASNSNSGAASSDAVAPAGMPVPGIPPSMATESVAVSGSSATGSIFDMNSPEMRAMGQEFRNQQGGPGGAGGPGGGFGPGGPGGGPGGGGFGGPAGGGGMIFRGRGFKMNQPHGMVFYSANTSALNATPYALSGQPSEKPGYLQQRFGASIGGPLNIPHIYHGGSKTFYFFNYNGSYGDTPYNFLTTVPTALERSGDFSQTLING